jgi:hypothetical protein
MAPLSDLVADRVVALADDVARLRRVTAVGSYAEHLVDRVAYGLESLDAIARLTAAERFRGLAAFGWAEDAAVAEALAEVDADACALQRRLGRVVR